MKNTILSGIQPSSIWVSGPNKTHSKTVIISLLARTVDEGDTRIFMLADSIRDLRDRSSFLIMEATEIRDKTGSYECIEVIPYTVLNKNCPMIKARRVA